VGKKKGKRPSRRKRRVEEEENEKLWVKHHI
jgi:hypothetical protein